MNQMTNHYKVNLYFSGIEHEMIMNAKSKIEAIIILTKIYKKDMEKSKVIIKIRDLTYEERQTYKID